MNSHVHVVFDEFDSIPKEDREIIESTERIFNAMRLCPTFDMRQPGGIFLRNRVSRIIQHTEAWG